MNENRKSPVEDTLVGIDAPNPAESNRHLHEIPRRWLANTRAECKPTGSGLTCLREPETTFHVLPMTVSEEAPFLYQILSLASIAQTCPFALTDTYENRIKVNQNRKWISLTHVLHCFSVTGCPVFSHWGFIADPPSYNHSTLVIDPPN